MNKFACSLILGFSLLGSETGFAAGTSRTTILFFPPENLTKQSSLAWIGEALVHSIASQIDKPGVECLSRETRLSLIEDADLPPNAPLSKASMIRVAQLAEADELVFGLYSGNENSLRVIMQVLDMKTMKLGTAIISSGPASNLAEMENELAWGILVQRGLQGGESREVFHNRTRKVPNAAYAPFVLGLGATDEEGRIKLWQEALDKHEDFPEALAQLGRHYFREGDCARAVQRLEGVLGREKFYREAQLMLGTCYCKLGINSKAIRAYSELLAFDPPMEVLNNLGVAYLREGNLTLAADHLKRALRMEETNSVVMLNLATVRYLQGDYPASLSLLDETLKTNASHGLGHYLRSRILRERGDSVKSAEALAQSIRLGIDPEKLKLDDPQNWTQIFMTPARIQ